MWSLLIPNCVSLIPCRLGGELRGWQVHGSEPATSLKFPERHFLGWFVKLCVLAYRSFPGFEEEKKKETKPKTQAVLPHQQEEHP